MANDTIIGIRLWNESKTKAEWRTIYGDNPPKLGEKIIISENGKPKCYCIGDGNTSFEELISSQSMSPVSLVATSPNAPDYIHQGSTLNEQIATKKEVVDMLVEGSEIDGRFTLLEENLAGVLNIGQYKGDYETLPTDLTNFNIKDIVYLKKEEGSNSPGYYFLTLVAKQNGEEVSNTKKWKPISEFPKENLTSRIEAVEEHFDNNKIKTSSIPQNEQAAFEGVSLNYDGIDYTEGKGDIPLFTGNLGYFFKTNNSYPFPIGILESGQFESGKCYNTNDSTKKPEVAGGLEGGTTGRMTCAFEEDWNYRLYSDNIFELFGTFSFENVEENIIYYHVSHSDDSGTAVEVAYSTAPTFYLPTPNLSEGIETGYLQNYDYDTSFNPIVNITSNTQGYAYVGLNECTFVSGSTEPAINFRIIAYTNNAYSDNSVKIFLNIKFKVKEKTEEGVETA